MHPTSIGYDTFWPIPMCPQLSFRPIFSSWCATWNSTTSQLLSPGNFWTYQVVSTKPIWCLITCLTNDWLVVYLPLWKIWKSVGMIIPNIWENKTCSKPPTRWCSPVLLSMIQFLPDYSLGIRAPPNILERKRNPTDSTDPFEAPDHIQPTGHVPASVAAAARDGSSYLSSAWKGRGP